MVAITNDDDWNSVLVDVPPLPVLADAPPPPTALAAMVFASRLSSAMLPLRLVPQK